MSGVSGSRGNLPPPPAVRARPPLESGGDMEGKREESGDM